MVTIVGAIAILMVVAFANLGNTEIPGDQVPRVQVMTSPPTLSQDFQPGDVAGGNPPVNWPTPIPQALPTATVPLPTPIPSATLPPGNLAIGVTVEVVGVGASGLNIRSAPGLTGTPRLLAAEGEVFVVTDGPQVVNELEWWLLEDPNDPNRFGWAARNYLAATSP